MKSPASQFMGTTRDRPIGTILARVGGGRQVHNGRDGPSSIFQTDSRGLKMAMGVGGFKVHQDLTDD